MSIRHQISENPWILIPIAGFTPFVLAAIIGAAVGHFEPLLAIVIVAAMFGGMYGIVHLVLSRSNTDDL